MKKLLGAVFMLCIFSLTGCATRVSQIESDCLVNNSNVLYRDLTKPIYYKIYHRSIVQRQYRLKKINQHLDHHIARIYFKNNTIAVNDIQKLKFTALSYLRDSRTRLMLMGYSYGKDNVVNQDSGYKRTSTLNAILVQAGIPAKRIIQYSSLSGKNSRLCSRIVDVYVTYS